MILRVDIGFTGCEKPGTHDLRHVKACQLRFRKSFVLYNTLSLGTTMEHRTSTSKIELEMRHVSGQFLN